MEMISKKAEAKMDRLLVLKNDICFYQEILEATHELANAELEINFNVLYERGLGNFIKTDKRTTKTIPSGLTKSLVFVLKGQIVELLNKAIKEFEELLNGGNE